MEKIKSGIANQLLINDKVYILNEFPIYFNTHSIKDENIQLEETRVKKLVKKEQPAIQNTPNEPMSQIDKFYARYGTTIKKNF